MYGAPSDALKGYLIEVTAMVQLQMDKDHAFDAYFPVESSASSLQDVTKLEFTKIHRTDEIAAHVMSARTGTSIGCPRARW